MLQMRILGVHTGAFCGFYRIKAVKQAEILADRRCSPCKSRIDILARICYNISIISEEKTPIRFRRKV